MPKSKIYYHFTTDTLRDGRPIPAIEEWLTHEGPVIICSSGLHASECPFDALEYAPGVMLHQVKLDDIVDSQDDKVVARRRKIVATIDATELLRTFARKQALSVIHLWDCPTITKQYLETGDETLREAACSAAEAARSVTWSAAWAAEAARSAAWAAEAARSAAEAAEAARSVTWSAWSAAGVAVAARSDARKQFKNMVEEAFNAEKAAQ